MVARVRHAERAGWRLAFPVDPDVQESQLIEGIQMSDCEAAPLRPLAPFVKIDADGKPYLEGLKCAACGEVLAVGGRRACPKCAAVGMLVPVRLAERGR